jgi:uncharacterized Fe-S cluster-containing protein
MMMMIIIIKGEKIKNTVKFVLEHATKSQRESGCVALFLL